MLRGWHRVFLLFLCLPEIQPANILFLYFPLLSHIRGSMHVAKELASRGHVVWIATTTELATDKDIMVAGVNILPYKSIDDFNLQETTEKVINDYLWTGKIMISLDKLKLVTGAILRDAELFQAIKSLDFDLVVLDIVPISRMLTVLPYKLDIPFMFMGAAYEPYVSRTPFNLATYPFALYPWTTEMDFFPRLFSSVRSIMYYVYDPFTYYTAVAMYAPERPYLTMEALSAKGLLWLMELEPLLDYPRSVMPNVKFTGSLSATKPRPLPERYRKFMDEGEDGVIIVSFGSIVKQIPEHILTRFVQSFTQIKYKVVFKANAEIEVPPHIMLTDWMPQNDLLAHRNTRLFITHCGCNGQNEAFLNGVPMIGFPMFAEQHFNARRMEFHEYGLMMNMRNFTVEELVSNIHQVMQNTSYANNIKTAVEVTHQLRTREPVQEAAFWIDHVVKYGGKHLRSYSQDMPLYQYLSLDLIGLFLLILHLMVFVIYKTCDFCCARCCRRLGKEKAKVE